MEEADGREGFLGACGPWQRDSHSAKPRHQIAPPQSHFAYFPPVPVFLIGLSYEREEETPAFQPTAADSHATRQTDGPLSARPCRSPEYRRTAAHQTPNGHFVAYAARHFLLLDARDGQGRTRGTRRKGYPI